MADNTVLNTGAGGDTIASDDIAGIKHQRVKVEFGADGSATDVSSTNPLPVDNSGVTQPVSGTFWQATQPVSLATAPTTPVTGTFWQATQPVSGTVTADAGTNLNTSALLTTVAHDAAFGTAGTADAQVRTVQGIAGGTAVPVSGTFWQATQPVSGTVTIGTFPDNEPFNAAQWGGTASAGGSGAATAGSPRVIAATDSPEVTALQIMDDWDNAASDGASVSGDVAHDGVDAGEPIKIGYRAIAHGTNPTAVAAADRTDAYANRAGIPFTLGGHPNVVTIEAAYTAAQTDAAIVTIATGLKIVVTQIQMTADNANTVDVGFRVGFGTANTPTTTGVILTHPGVAAGSGISRGDGSGILGVGADNEDLRITSEVPTTGSIRILVSYFTVES